MINKNYLRAWLLAIRLRTLPLSFSPVLLGCALVLKSGFTLNWTIAFSALFCALSIQIGTNLVNDALDFKKGVDGEKRIGPKRVTQGGLLSYQVVLCGGFFSFALAFFFGIPLMLAGGWLFLGLLLFSIILGYLYTGGPYPLSYLGISDFLIVIFFGLVPVEAVEYLQTQRFESDGLIAGMQIGLLACVPHAINNLRDRMTDEQAHKRTLAVRFGRSFVLGEILFCSLFPFILCGVWAYLGKTGAAIFPFMVFPMIMRNVRVIFDTNESPQYNDFLAKSALCQFLFSCLLAVGI